MVVVEQILVAIFAKLRGHFDGVGQLGGGQLGEGDRNAQKIGVVAFALREVGIDGDLFASARGLWRDGGGLRYDGGGAGRVAERESDIQRNGERDGLTHGESSSWSEGLVW